MNSKRLLQNVLVQSARYSVAAQRPIFTVTSSAAVRSRFALNRGALIDMPVRYALVQQRQFNSNAEPSSFKVVDYNDIQKLIHNSDKSYSLIDVREEKEVVQGAIPTAKNVPLSQFASAWSLSDKEFKEHFGFEKPKKDASVILYCLGGVRSTRAAEHLASLGYDNLSNYIGSWADYVEKQKGEQ
ncbi:S-(hydroxymethyl)glutathione dehydrogenase [Mucor velutinosus]|uniref:S-(Hydroxymethyl)glutathione dehydrogenase n=1 Tax=Mucor velutinosus TaxID=708070 RepID=A0AAN7D8V8_9FUNG|nr:S-(hydroxymethyl)glutathione dehydrogenase [Mucor velutinosus]